MLEMLTLKSVLCASTFRPIVSFDGNPLIIIEKQNKNRGSIVCGSCCTLYFLKGVCKLMTDGVMLLFYQRYRNFKAGVLTATHNKGVGVYFV